jgi:hypothetical protein
MYNENLRPRQDAIASAQQQSQALTVRTKVRAGGLATNHTEAIAVRTKVRAGGLTQNHSQAVAQIG